ncbi:hypothetical protein AB0J13_10745 [Streptomyces anulatus]|uniref:hypothetical protein n=1 Tax=Streptomyces anulatus TaxID=1892 RepID=UPI0034027F61
MTAPRRGRGRPTVFEPPTQIAYLDAVRHGMNLGDAAAHVGISRVVPTRYARAVREFAAALEEARAVGAKVRRESVPHGEYRYNVLGCRCPDCTRAATTGRAARRADATPAPTADESPAETAGDVHPIRLGTAEVGESLTSFLLARAS